MSNDTLKAVRPRAWLPALLGLATLAALAGCSGNRVQVSGTVTAKGERVKGGTLVFSPVGADPNQTARAATAAVQPDGTFSLGTNSPGDGAPPGRYRVSYTPPAQELTEQQRSDPKYTAPPPPYLGLAPKQAEVEIPPGGGTLTIELVAAKKKN